MNGSEISHGKNKATPTAPKTQAGHDAETGSCSLGRGSPLTTNAESVNRTKVAAEEIRGNPRTFEIWSLGRLMRVKAPSYIIIIRSVHGNAHD